MLRSTAAFRSLVVQLRWRFPTQGALIGLRPSVEKAYPGSSNRKKESPSVCSETKMALELIGAGLGRTGTLSLKAALERIGYGSCYQHD
jgi:hypothetical protein